MRELCRRANLTGVGGASRRLPAAQEGVHPSSAAGTEVTLPPSSAASATVLEDNSDPVDMDSGLIFFPKASPMLGFSFSC